MNNYHTSVLLHEIINLLDVQKGKKYIDATLGGGGHSAGILEKGGKVLGIDTDSEAIEYIKKNFQFSISNFQLKVVRGNFGDIDNIAKANKFDQAAGILFDLGVSSHQFDTAERGFSFRNEGPLDMRMDKDLEVTAAGLVNILTKGELYDLFSKLGEEGFARVIANNIARARRIKAIETTWELSEIINNSVPNIKIRLDANARIFQALRIAVNDELNSLRRALPKAFKLLEPKGKIAVISFHSLEDRIVKKQFMEWETQGKGTVLTKKPVRPSETEIENNKRSSSAKLRVFERKIL